MSTLIGNKYTAKCTKCANRASVRVTYAKINLCKDHFIEYVEERVRKTISRYKMMNGVKKLLVALSGGKDSLSLAYILNNLKNEIGVNEIIGFHIDLGISTYSEESRKLVEEACQRLGLKCIIVSLRDLFEYTLPELVKKTRRPACSLCGLIKRYLINLTAIITGVDAVSLGHHMEDVLIFAIKDFLLQDIRDMSKMVPVSPGIPGLIATRLKVLYEIYEEDLSLYAKLREIRYVEIPCPYKHADPFKIVIRKMLDELEDYAPGFKITLARRLAKNILNYIPTRNEIKPCQYCGMPSSKNTCAFCKLSIKTHGSPQGLLVRERICSSLLL